MEVATIEVKRSRGNLVVLAVGRTGKGQKYLKGIAPLKATSTSDPKFKSELAEAVTKLLKTEA